MEEIEQVSAQLNRYTTLPGTTAPQLPTAPGSISQITPSLSPAEATISQQEATLYQAWLQQQTQAWLQQQTQAERQNRTQPAQPPVHDPEVPNLSPRNIKVGSTEFLSGLYKLSPDEIEGLLSEDEAQKDETGKGFIAGTSNWLGNQQKTTVWAIGALIVLFFAYLATNNPIVQQKLQNSLPPAAQTEQPIRPAKANLPATQKSVSPSNPKPQQDKKNRIVPIPQSTPPEL